MKKYYPENFIKSLEQLKNDNILPNSKKDYIKYTTILIQNKIYRKKIGNLFKERMELVNANTYDFLKVLNG